MIVATPSTAQAYMFYVNNWILGASLFLISIVSLVLLFQKSRGFEPQRLLGVAFLAIICYGLTYLAISTGTLTEFPFLYRIGCPFYYLVPPCFYLYFRFLLQDKHSLRKADLFHLIPFALAMVDMAGYYWGTTAEAKMEELLRVQNSPILVFDTGAGFLPAISHFYFRVLQSVIYLFLQWTLILSVRRAWPEPVSRAWIWLLILFESFLYGGNLVMTIFGTYRENLTLVPVVARAFQFMSGLMMLSLIAIGYYMLFKPELLYGSGFRQVGPVEKEEAAVEERELLSQSGGQPVVPALRTEHCERLEAYLKEKKPFLRKRLTLSELAVELDMPSYILSGLLNNYYEQNFNDFINDYRVEYVIERMRTDPSWKSLTMEGLALDAGFSSRTAFYTAFKKRKGMSPGSFARKSYI